MNNMLTLSIIFGIVQIMMWTSISKRLKELMIRRPMFAITANIISSLIIVYVAGTSAMVGTCNLGGSLIFAGYIYMVRLKRKLLGEMQ